MSLTINNYAYIYSCNCIFVFIENNMTIIVLSGDEIFSLNGRLVVGLINWGDQTIQGNTHGHNPSYNITGKKARKVSKLMGNASAKLRTFFFVWNPNIFVS